MDDEVLSDISAERGTLAGLVKYGSDAFLDVDDVITVNSFTSEQHQAIYHCLRHFFNEGGEKPDIASIHSISDKLGFGNLISSEQERKYLRSVLNYPIELDNVRRLAGKVRKLEITRLIREQLDECKTNINSITGDESLAHILGLVEKPIFDFASLLDNGNEATTHIGNGLDDYVEYLIANPCTQIGISTGYKFIDKVIGGGARPGVSLFAARAKAGKTFLANNISINVASTSIPVLEIDTEMQRTDLWNRSISRVSGVMLDDIENGMFAKNPESLRKVREAVDLLKSYPFETMSAVGLETEDMIAAIRRWLVKKVGYDSNGNINKCLIVYDYLKLMDAGKLSSHMQEYALLGFIMSALHNFAAKHKVPIISFAQLNRDGLSKESIEAIAGSDRLSWYCTNLNIFKKKSPEEIAEDIGTLGKKNGNRKFKNIITRYGRGHDDDDYINMQFDGEVAKITELNEQSSVQLQQPQPVNNGQPAVF